MIDHTRRLPANERLKRRFDEILGGSLIAAAALHFLVLQLWPPISVVVAPESEDAPIHIVPLDRIELPPTPQPLTRPVAPVPVADAPVEATIEPVDFTAARQLPPPPRPTETIAGRDDFTPFELAPRLLNVAEFQRALERAYPASLRDGGIGGVVVLAVHVGEDGRVREARVTSGSGYERLDEAALGLVELMRFSAAMNRDRTVAVWVEVPVEFRVRRRDGRDGKAARVGA